MLFLRFVRLLRQEFLLFPGQSAKAKSKRRKIAFFSIFLQFLSICRNIQIYRRICRRIKLLGQ